MSIIKNLGLPQWLQRLLIDSPANDTGNAFEIDLNGTAIMAVPGTANPDANNVNLAVPLQIDLIRSHYAGVNSISLTFNGPITLKTISTTNSGMLFVDATNLPATAVALVAKAQNGASGDVFQLQNNAGTAIAGVDAIGVLYGLDVALFAQKLTASTTLTMTSPHYIWVDASAGAVTVTLPASSGNPIRTYLVKKIDSTANAVTIAAAGTDTIEGAASISLASQWTFRVLTNTQAGEWYITGGSTL